MKNISYNALNMNENMLKITWIRGKSRINFDEVDVGKIVRKIRNEIY